MAADGEAANRYVLRCLPEWRSVGRGLFTFCACVSGVLCVAACALWVRSYRASDYMGRGDRGGLGWVGALSMSGIIRIERGDYAAGPAGWQYEKAPPNSLRQEVEARDRAGGRVLHQLGFALASIAYDRQRTRHALYVPHWAVTAVSGILPVLWGVI